MKDSVQFFVLLGVVALSNFQTSMTLWSECRKSTEAIIKHIDERCAAVPQNFGSLASDDALVIKNTQGDGFIVVGNHTASNAVASENGNESLKLGGNLGKNQIKSVLPVPQGAPLQKGANALCNAEPYKAVNNGVNQIPSDVIGEFNGADDVLHGANDKAANFNKSITEVER